MRMAVRSLISAVSSLRVGFLLAILTVVSAPRTEVSPLCGTEFYDPYIAHRSL